MTDNVVIQPAGRRIKTAAGRPTFAAGARIGWSDVLRALPSDESRSKAMAVYRAGDWTPDDFGRLRLAREAVAYALTRAEDLVEGQHVSARRDAELAGLRAVRRRLEQELWP